MNNQFSKEIEDVVGRYTGLSFSELDDKRALSGLLGFSAEYEGLETISANFDVAISIPPNYPDELPKVFPNGFRLDERFDHVNPDGSFCLAVPQEERRLFDVEPSLLGFINKLVIPYLYSYCYYMKHEEFPFGESAHGDEGILEHYRDLFDSNDIGYTLLALNKFCESGYKSHESCPCGSKKKVMKCHKPELKALLNNRALLRIDLNKFIQG